MDHLTKFNQPLRIAADNDDDCYQLHTDDTLLTASRHCVPITVSTNVLYWELLVDIGIHNVFGIFFWSVRVVRSRHLLARQSGLW